MLFISSTQKFKAFPTIIYALSHAIAVTFAVCGETEKQHEIFLCSSSFHEWKIRSCHTTWQSPHIIFFFYIAIITRIFTFPLMERTSRLILDLEALAASLLLRFGAIITVNKGFLNTNTAITRQLIWTARKLEAEWRLVCGEAWVRGQREMSQLLGTFGLLGFTMFRPVLAWRAFWNLWTVYFFNVQIFFSPGPR